VQPASVPPKPAASAATPADTLRLNFSTTQIALSDADKAALDKIIAASAADEETRIEVLAYAENVPDDPSKARRMSLSRALAVRSHLIDGGVRSTRIDVRALGDEYGNGPHDRVDVRLVK
jgi:outer membrane protein OmpA-like peptidoglycan-associated protein